MTTTTDLTIRPFEVHVPEKDLADLVTPSWSGAHMEWLVAVGWRRWPLSGCQ
jgi:hypothetical protein